MDEYENNPITEDTESTELQDGGQEEAEDLQEQHVEAEGEEAENADGQEPAEEPGDGSRARQQQTHADNAAARAARLRAERETEERINRQVDEDIRKMGLVDPYTNQPIRTRAELNAYSKRAQEEQIRDRAERENRPASEIRQELENQQLAEQKRKELQEEKAKADADKRQKDFLAQDAADFMAKYPNVDIMKLEANDIFREFCGSRFGREPLAELYESYLKITGGAAAQSKAKSREARGVGGGAGTAGSGLTAAQQEALNEWNRNNPEMKMTAKEFLER